jgi:hypothetical protein
MPWLKRLTGKIPPRAVSFIALLAAFGLFFGQQWVVSEKLSVEKRIATIKKDGYFLALDTWQAEFYSCENYLGCPSDSVALGFAEKRAGEIVPTGPSAWTFGKSQNIPQPANLALLTYHLPTEELPNPEDWPYVALVIPRSLHQLLEVQIGETSYPVFASHGQTIHINAATSALFQNPLLKLRFEFAKYPRFGPLEFPIALVDAKNAQSYADSAATLESRSLTGRDWQMAVPMLIAFLMLWINHAPAYAALAIYGMAFSLRSALYFLAENQFLPHWQAWICIAHLLTIAALVKFLSLLSGVGKAAERKFLFSGMLLTAVACVCTLWFGESVSTDARYVDLIADCVLGIVGILLLSFSIFSHKPKNGPAFFPTVEDLQHLSFVRRRKTHSLSLGVAAAGLFVLLVDNVYSIVQLKVMGQKPPTDILIIVHFLALCAAVFVRLGTTREMISSQGRLLARYLAKSREKLRFSRLMNALISSSHHHDQDGITWEVTKSSQDMVGGDWHDLRVMSGKEHKVLVCALFDVTGHDLLAAGHHVMIAAQWNLALSHLQLALNLETNASAFLANFAGPWLQSLNAQCFHAPGKLGASGAVILWDFLGETIYIAAAGQRSLRVLDLSEASNLLHFSSDRLGLVAQGHFATKAIPSGSVSGLQIASDGAEPFDQKSSRDDATSILIGFKKQSQTR